MAYMIVTKSIFFNFNFFWLNRILDKAFSVHILQIKDSKLVFRTPCFSNTKAERLGQNIPCIKVNDMLRADPQAPMTL